MFVVFMFLCSFWCKKLLWIVVVFSWMQSCHYELAHVATFLCRGFNHFWYPWKLLIFCHSLEIVKEERKNYASQWRINKTVRLTKCERCVVCHVNWSMNGWKLSLAFPLSFVVVVPFPESNLCTKKKQSTPSEAEIEPTQSNKIQISS